MRPCRNPGDALIVASAIGNTEVVSLLLDQGANPNAVDANGFTSLHHAVRIQTTASTRYRKPSRLRS